MSGPVLLETSQPLGGTSSARINDSAAYLQEGFLATADLYVRVRVRLTGPSSVSPRILMLSSGGTTTTNLVLLPTGRLRLRNGSTAIGADSAPLAIGTTYVIGLHMRRGTGTNGLVEAFLASDGDAFLTPFASTANGTWTGSTDRLRVGATTGTASLLIDDLVIADGGMPGAVATVGTIILAAAVPGATLVREPSQQVLLAPLELAAPTRNRYFACLI